MQSFVASVMIQKNNKYNNGNSSLTALVGRQRGPVLYSVAPAVPKCVALGMRSNLE